MTVLVVAVAVALGYLVKGVTGFGSVLIAMPLLVLVLPPPTAMLVISAGDVIGGAALAWHARGQVRWALLPAVLVPLFAGQVVGTSLLGTLDPAVVRRLLGLTVAVVAVGLLWRPVRPEGQADRADVTSTAGVASAVVAGGAAGLLSGLVGAPGPPIALWVRRYLGDAAGRALLLWIFLPSSVALSGLLLGRGLATPDALWLVGAAVPAALVGGWAGAWLAARISPVAFGRAVGGVLLASGVALGVG